MREEYRIELWGSELKKFDTIIKCILTLLSICIMVIISVNIKIVGVDNKDIYFFGYKPAVVISGSMEPVIKTNSLVLLKEADIEEVKAGDIISFRVNKVGLVTHRVLYKGFSDLNTKDGNNNKEFWLITKGDANKHEDPWLVTNTELKSKVVYINTDIAPIITYLFGSFVKVSYKQVGVGFIFLALVISGIIYILNWLYDFITIGYFFKKYNYTLLDKTLYWVDNRVSFEDMRNVLHNYLRECDFWKRLILQYRLMRLYYAIRKEEAMVIKTNKMYNKLSKEINKNRE